MSSYRAPPISLYMFQYIILFHNKLLEGIHPKTTHQQCPPATDKGSDHICAKLSLRVLKVWAPGFPESLLTAAFIAAAGGDNAWEGSDSTHQPSWLAAWQWTQLCNAFTSPVYLWPPLSTWRTHNTHRLPKTRNMTPWYCKFLLKCTKLYIYNNHNYIQYIGNLEWSHCASLHCIWTKLTKYGGFTNFS